MNPRHPPRVFYFSRYQLIMKNLYLSLSLLLGMTLHAQIYQGSTSLGSTMTLDVTLNTNTDSVDVEISGPASGYFAVGFGGTGMNGTYIMLVNSNGTVKERKLGQWNGGSTLSSSISYSAITFKWNANGLYRKSTYRCFNQSLYFPVQRRLYCAHLGERRYILWQSWEFESRIRLDQLDQSVQHCHNDINNPEHLSGRFCANLWTVGQPARYVFRYPSNCHRL